MKHSTGYRKVLLFAAFAAAVVALAACDKISGDAALTAVSSAFTAAIGLNILEHRKGSPPALPAAIVPPLPRAGARRRKDLEDPEMTDVSTARPAVSIDELVQALTDLQQGRGR